MSPAIRAIAQEQLVKRCSREPLPRSNWSRGVQARVHVGVPTLPQTNRLGGCCTPLESKT